MQSTNKNLDLENFLTQTFGFDRRETIKANKCAPPPIGCGRDIKEEDFINEIQRREFAISSLCPKCQDEIFDSL